MGRELKSVLQKPRRSLYIVYNRTLKTTGTTKENIGTPNGQSQEGIAKYTMTKCQMSENVMLKCALL